MADVIEYDAIIITTPKDYEKTLDLHMRMAEYLPVRDIYVVSSEGVCPILAEEDIGTFRYIDENDIVKFDDVYIVVEKHLSTKYAGQEISRGIVGWYYQQILKFEYHRISKDRYYLTWDGDTIPCKSFSMFDKDGKTPFLDMKHEYNEDYFTTLSKLLPGYEKCMDKSFISEHMLFNREIVKSLIEDIEANDQLEGDIWWEKMIRCIPPEKYTDGCFSEFETYGNYVCKKYPDSYNLRSWNSFRYAAYFLEPARMQSRDWRWLSKDFYALSFEKNQTIREDYKNIFDNPKYQKKLSARQVLEICQEEMESGYKEVWD
ncbi:MAG: DUF6492 family protein [Lachnospiraceae bacterium]|nr:DUF6492 family protein [Lachnospiraceae bacterium]